MEESKDLKVIPVGSRTYRSELIGRRRLSKNHPAIPSQIHIAKDSEPVRVLGAFVGNKVSQVLSDFFYFGCNQPALQPC